ncbi:hypothetical protein JO41_07700 [Treponema sp. OMZ 838]|nr:hypothetical protein JO41_07700 [Treponema sp. OMZ 838]
MFTEPYAPAFFNCPKFSKFFSHGFFDRAENIFVVGTVHELWNIAIFSHIFFHFFSKNIKIISRNAVDVA